MITLDLATLKPAVLVVDMQAVFVSPDGPFANASAGPLVAALNPFLAGCRGHGVPVIFSNYLLRDDLRDAGLLRTSPAARHITESAPSAVVDQRIVRAPTDLEVRHSRPSALFRSELVAVLADLGVDALILTGVSVNNAISSTARDAFAHDIPALVVRDCVGAAPWEPAELLASYFDALATWTAEVADAADVLERLAAR